MGLNPVIEVILQRDDYHLLEAAKHCVEQARQTRGASSHTHTDTHPHMGQEKEVMGCPDWMTLWECLFYHTSAFSVSLSFSPLSRKWMTKIPNCILATYE